MGLVTGLGESVRAMFAQPLGESRVELIDPRNWEAYRVLHVATRKPEAYLLALAIEQCYIAECAARNLDPSTSADTDFPDLGALFRAQVESVESSLRDARNASVVVTGSFEEQSRLTL